MEKFDWKQAIELEKEYRKNWNIRKLADINIEFCEKFSAAYTFQTRLPKVFFYLGRLNAINELNDFIYRNKSNFLFVDASTAELSQKCVDYGFHYDNLLPSIKKEICAYFANPEYAELFLEMMFDYEHYIEDVQPFDFSIRNVRNTVFSVELVENIAKGILDFSDIQFSDRSKNQIIVIEEYEHAISGVHFILDITAITNKRLSEIVEFILEKLNINVTKHKERILQILLGEDDSKYSDMFGFNGDFIIVMSQYIYELDLITVESEIKLQYLISNVLALDFLNFINQE